MYTVRARVFSQLGSATLHDFILSRSSVITFVHFRLNNLYFDWLLFSKNIFHTTFIATSSQRSCTSFGSLWTWYRSLPALLRCWTDACFGTGHVFIWIFSLLILTIIVMFGWNHCCFTHCVENISPCGCERYISSGKLINVA